ncbi:hypothetical protein HLRTI_003193, partial [Halorhabdus tiamatea SARL4B]
MRGVELVRCRHVVGLQPLAVSLPSQIVEELYVVGTCLLRSLDG